MSKDYSILYNFFEDENNDKEVEEKYSEFLDSLKELIINNKRKNTFFCGDGIGQKKTELPIKFKDIIFVREKRGNTGEFNYKLYDDIFKYLSRRKILIYFLFKNANFM